MKQFILSSLATGVVLVGTVSAIPQTVGGLFTTAANNPGNLPVEEWFRDAKHWAPGATPPGPWVMGTVPTGMMLRDPGAVFGINASSVVIARNDAGAIVSVAVFYDAESARVPAGDLHRRLSRAVALFTGADGKAAGYTVTLSKPNAGAVTATLKR